VKKSNKLTAAVTASMVASTLVVPAAFASTNLTDIDNSYAKDAILELVNAGIINGTGDGKFNPAGKISRQDFAIILAKALELDTDDVPATPTFSDVPASHYSYKFVEAAVKAELIAGLGEGKFGLGQNLTREQMAVLFVRATGEDVTGYGDKLTFSDADKISAWAKDAVGYAVEIGLMNGAGNNSFNPQGLAERQQVALVASNFLQVKKPEVIKAVSAKQVDETTITVEFSGEVAKLTDKDLAVAAKATNTAVAIESVTLAEDKKSATIKVAKLAPATTYAISFNGSSVDVTTQDIVGVTSVAAVDAKTLEVKFSQAVDTTKVTFATTRNGNPVVLTATFAEDKKSAKLASATSLVAGSYVVTVGGTDFAAGKNTGTVEVSAEKVAKIEILSDKLVKSDANTGTVGYKVFNQYNEDITSKALASNLSLSASVATTGLTKNNGLITLDASSDFVANQAIILTVVDAASGVTATKTVNVSDAANVTDFTFGDVVLPTGAARIETGLATAATIKVSGADQYGNVLDTQALLTGGVSFLTSDASVTVALGNNNDNKAVLTVNTTGLTSAKTVTVIAVVKATGQTKTYSLNIVKPAEAAEVAVTAPTATIANGDTAGSVVVAVDAKDQFGTALTADQIVANAAGITITSSNSNVLLSSDLAIATTGANKGKIVSTQAVRGAGTTTITVTVNATGKSSSFVLETKAARAINTLSLPTTLAGNLIEGATTSFRLAYKDQYGKAFDATGDVAGYKVNVSVTKVSGDDAALTVSPDGDTANESLVDTNSVTPITLTAAANKKGVFTLTAKLINTTTGEVVSSESKTINVVENNSTGITYNVDDIAKLYKNGADFNTADVIEAEDVAAGYAKEIKISAKDAAGNSYVIPASSIVRVTSDNAALLVSEVDGKWYTAGNGTNPTADINANLSVVVNTNDGVKTIVKPVVISKDDLAVSEVKILNNTIDTADVAAVTSLTFANRAELEAGKDAFVYFVDQFGGTALTAGTANAVSYLTNLNGFTKHASDTVEITGNKLVLTDADDNTTGNAGAKFRYVLVTGNGKTAHIDVTITNALN